MISRSSHDKHLYQNISWSNTTSNISYDGETIFFECSTAVAWRWYLNLVSSHNSVYHSRALSASKNLVVIDLFYQNF